MVPEPSQRPLAYMLAMTREDARWALGLSIMNGSNDNDWDEHDSDEHPHPQVFPPAIIHHQDMLNGMDIQDGRVLTDFFTLKFTHAYQVYECLERTYAPSQKTSNPGRHAASYLAREVSLFPEWN